MTPRIAQWWHDWWRSTQPCLESLIQYDPDVEESEDLTESERLFVNRLETPVD